MMAAKPNGAASHVRVVASSTRRRLDYSDLAAAYETIGRDRDWTIEGAIERTPIMVLAGAEKRGKSWMLADLVRVVTMGGKWLGAFESRVRGDAVVIESEYHAPEYARRLARLARGAGQDPREMFRRVRHYSAGDIFLDHDNEALAKLLHDVRDEPPALIVIDPLRNFLGGEENSATDIIEAMRLIATIRDAANAPIALAHHLNKGGTMSGSRALKTRADLFIEGTDEEEPSYSAIGRTIRTDDAIAKPFRVQIVHEDDGNDTIAATRMRCRFQGENRTREGLSTTARKLLATLKSANEPITSNRLGTLTNTNGKVRGRALEELRSSGVATCTEGKWSVSKAERWNEFVEESGAEDDGGQDADAVY